MSTYAYSRATSASATRKSKGEKVTQSVLNELQSNNGRKIPKRPSFETQKYGDVLKETNEKDKIIEKLKQELLIRECEILSLKETLAKIKYASLPSNNCESDSLSVREHGTLNQRIRMWSTKVGVPSEGRQRNGKRNPSVIPVIKRHSLPLRKAKESEATVPESRSLTAVFGSAVRDGPLNGEGELLAERVQGQGPVSIPGLVRGDDELIEPADVNVKPDAEPEPSNAAEFHSNTPVDVIDCSLLDNVASLVAQAEEYMDGNANGSTAPSPCCSLGTAVEQQWQQDVPLMSSSSSACVCKDLGPQLLSADTGSTVMLTGSTDQPLFVHRKRSVSVSVTLGTGSRKPAGNKSGPNLAATRAGDLINSVDWTPDAYHWALNWVKDDSSSGESEDSGFGDTGLTLGQHSCSIDDNDVDKYYDNDSPSSAISIGSILNSDNRYLSPSTLAGLAAAVALEAKAGELYQVLLDELRMFRQELGYG